MLHNMVGSTTKLCILLIVGVLYLPTTLPAILLSMLIYIFFYDSKGKRDNFIVSSNNFIQMSSLTVLDVT